MTKAPIKLPPPVFDDPKHHIRLYQGDSLQLLALLPESSVDLIFADPPYFLSNGGITCHAGKMVSVNKGAWDKSQGPAANHEFNRSWLAACQRVLKPNGSLWVSGTAHVIHSVGFAMQQLGFKLLNDISWVKPNPPLAATARRAGWIGCNILLHQIPQDAKIGVIKEKRPVPPGDVRRTIQKLKPLASLKPETRSWTLDVLNAVRSLNKSEFSLAEAYAFEISLAELHPDNHHIQPKIRQQLQVLRDLGLLEFLGQGSYRFR
jgi:DNA modification methylase